MMNKEKFLRDDWKTYKPKFVLCCKDCDAKIITKSFGSLIIKPYICQIKIEKL